MHKSSYKNQLKHQNSERSLSYNYRGLILQSTGQRTRHGKLDPKHPHEQNNINNMHEQPKLFLFLFLHRILVLQQII